MNNSVVVVLLASAILYGTPLLYAALGELLAERSGVLNLGVQGMMLVGAAMGFWTVQRIDVTSTIALPLAILVAAVAGAMMAAILAFLVITLRASQIVSGLALTIFAGALGLSSYLGNDLSLADDPARHQFGAVFPASMHDWPVVGPILFGQNVLVYALLGPRRAGVVLPLAHAAGPERPGGRRIALRRPTRWGSTSTATATRT